MNAALKVALCIAVLSACRTRHQDDKSRSTERRDTVVTPTMLPDTPVARTVDAYASAPTCEARAKVIVFPEHNLATLYARGCNPIVLDRRSAASDDHSHSVGTFIDSSDCDALTTGTTCAAVVKINGKRTSFRLVKEPDGSYLVDVRASELSQPTFIAIQAQLPTPPIVLRASAKLSKYFNYEFRAAHDTHYAVELDPPTAAQVGDRMYAYIAKDRPDAPALFDLLKDGKAHPVTVAVHYPKTKKSNEVLAMDAFIAPSYYETEAEHAFDPDGGT